MTEPREQTWDAATFNGARRDLLLGSLRLTPAQRFEWLEDAIDFAHRSGAGPHDTSSADLEGRHGSRTSTTGP